MQFEARLALSPERRGLVPFACRVYQALHQVSKYIEFYAEHRGKPFFSTLIEFMTSGPIVALELLAVDAIQQWRSLLGPTNSTNAKQEAPGSIRARFGTGIFNYRSAKISHDFFLFMHVCLLVYSSKVRQINNWFS